MIRCMAIDDEPLALTQLTGYIEKTPFLELVAACHSALQAIEILSEKEADLVFVDINMPDLSGIDFVRSLAHKPIVIFTTAYSEYALEGFRVDALDYLLKPISYNDFLKSAGKARRQYDLMNTNPLPSPNPEYLFIKADYKMLKIDIHSICYIEGMNEYIRIYMENIKPVMTLLSLKTMEEKLPKENFMRIHRSYIVNLRKITAVSKGRVIMDKETIIPVGEQYKERFNEHMRQFSIEN